jgi:NitT/TauT family transport system ATP-binding protein
VPCLHRCCVTAGWRCSSRSSSRALRDDFFRDLLHRGFSVEATEKQLDIAIDWGRYGELFDYDADSGELVITEVYSALQKALRRPS